MLVFSRELPFLAYAFPFLDMCSSRLSYVYLSSFPISAVSVYYPCASIPFAYDHHHHLFYYIFSVSKKSKKHTYLRSVLFCSFVNTSMCIVLFRVVPLPSMAALESYGVIFRSRRPPISVSFSIVVTLFVHECHVFNFPSAPCYIVPQRQGQHLRACGQ